MKTIRPQIRQSSFRFPGKLILVLCVTGTLSGCYTQLEKPGTNAPVAESPSAQPEDALLPGSGAPGGGGDPHEGVAWTNEHDHDWQALAEMRNEIEALVSDASCAGHGNCKSIWLEPNDNHKRSGWLVYSDFMLDEREFRARVHEHNEFSQYLHRKWNVRQLELYSFPNPPSVRCEFGRCVIGYRRD